jgi:hypothetical protein
MLMLRPGSPVKTGPAPKATTPASPAELPSAFKPRPTNGLNNNKLGNLGTDVKVGPAAKATGAGEPRLKVKGKAADALPQRVTPGPLSTQQARVDRPINRKRKLADIEDDSTSDESDYEDEDVYFVRKFKCIYGYVCLFEASLQAVKRQMSEIDDYLAEKHRRRRRIRR